MSIDKYKIMGYKYIDTEKEYNVLCKDNNVVVLDKNEEQIYKSIDKKNKSAVVIGRSKNMKELHILYGRGNNEHKGECYVINERKEVLDCHITEYINTDKWEICLIGKHDTDLVEKKIRVLDKIKNKVYYEELNRFEIPKGLVVFKMTLLTKNDTIVLEIKDPSKEEKPMLLMLNLNSFRTHIEKLSDNNDIVEIRFNRYYWTKTKEVGTTKSLYTEKISYENFEALSENKEGCIAFIYEAIIDYDAPRIVNMGHYNLANYNIIYKHYRESI